MDKETLLKTRPGTNRTVQTEVGEVKVRSLTRAEAYALRGKEYAEDELERKLIACAIVDPVLTEDEVGVWQQIAPAGELDMVVGVISEMSGMVKTNPVKEAYKSSGG